ncbi:hypothetical protein BJ878DRAFT_388567, partial [Calycina marina]
LEALQAIDPSIKLDTSSAGSAGVNFCIGKASSIGHCLIDTPIGEVKFNIMHAHTPFLLSIHDMDNRKVYLNNITNQMCK